VQGAMKIGPAAHERYQLLGTSSWVPAPGYQLLGTSSEVPAPGYQPRAGGLAAREVPDTRRPARSSASISGLLRRSPARPASHIQACGSL
jgi:hypothetical protein